MSGAEVSAVLGIISSAIAIIEASKLTYEAAKDAKGLHEAFRKVSDNIPLVLDTLKNAEKVQGRALIKYNKASTNANTKKDIQQSAQAAKPLITTCKENAQKLRDIFEKVIPGDHATRAERYWMAVQTTLPGKKRKVEDLMKEILERLQLLHTNQFFKEVARTADFESAIKDISKAPSSLPKEESRHSYYGSGSMIVNPGAGTQRNYTQSGGSGRMFNADTQHFGNVGR